MAKRMSDWYYTIPKEVRHSLMVVLSGMQQRCYNQKMHSFAGYGGRGVRVSREWYDDELKVRRLENFMKWALSNGYRRGLQIDRIDNNGDYAPDNCRWVTPKENGRNRRTNVCLTYNGETLCLAEWAEKLKIPEYIVKSRLKRGLSVGEILSTKVQSKDASIMFRGRKMPISRLAKEFGISRSLIRQRIKSGWDVERAVTKKPEKGNSKPVTYKGETNTIKYFARKYRCRYVSLCELIRTGTPIEKAIERLRR